jgi:hypothetical protein
MSLRFTPGYRILAWFSTRNVCLPELQTIDIEIHRMASELFTETLIQDIFYGVSFGRYDFLVDFSCKSGKVASHFVCEIARRFEEIDLRTSFSYVMCKTIYHEGIDKANQAKFPVRCYAFLRPLISIETLCKLFGEKLKEMPYSSERMVLLWNNSAFPVVFVVSNEIASEALMDSRVILDHLKEHLAESSTFLVLQFGSKDKEGKELFALTFIKLRKFPSDIYIPTSSKRSWFQKQLNALECLGWYDICTSCVSSNLSELQEMIFSIRQRNKDLIHQTSTTVLYEPYKRAGNELGEK